MVEIEFEKGELQTLEIKLFALKGEKIKHLLKSAAKRAATHARVIGSKQVRSLYTIDSDSVKAGIKGIRTIEMGAELLIASRRIGVNHYKAKQNRRGVYVSIKKGGGNTIKNSFGWNKTFFQRYEGPTPPHIALDRLPIRRLYGPAVPQLFENPAIQTEIEQAALKKYEERVAHELERMIGG